MQICYITQDNIKEFVNKDVYIYGAGEYAHSIENAFVRDGIITKAFIVDDKYICNMEEKSIPLSQYMRIDSPQNIIVNGISDVSCFKRITNKKIFSNIYVYYESVPLWKYDKNFAKLHAEDYAKVENLYVDEDSKNVMKAFLEAKRTGIAEKDISYASEENTYFNSLTWGKFSGAYVDCGAYNGDSVCRYMDFVKEFCEESCNEIFAFEPDKNNCAIMTEKFKSKSNIHCINKGIWNKKENLYFDSESNMKSKLSDSDMRGNIEVEVTDIDSIVSATKIGFIKMDVEGSELKGLEGAQMVINRDRPVLAISAYHKQEDLYKLPYYIKTFEDENFGYDLYLRHHGINAYELVLYAIPVNKNKTVR